MVAVDEDVAGLIDDAVHLVGIDEYPDLWGHTMMRTCSSACLRPPAGQAHLFAGLEPDSPCAC